MARRVSLRVAKKHFATAKRKYKRAQTVLRRAKKHDLQRHVKAATKKHKKHSKR